MRFVNVEEARSAPGVRLVVVRAVASPWSESAKGILAVKGIDALLVRASPPDDAVKQWTGSHNAPVLVLDRDPPRTHWSDILEAAERLDGHVSVVPADPEQRVQMVGLAHDLLGEGGLAWNVRLLAVHRGMTTGGHEGFAVPVAKYLAAKYGYASDRMDAVERSVATQLHRFTHMAEASRAVGSNYLLGDSITALDIYMATTFGILSPLPETECIGMHPEYRHAFETASPSVRAALPSVLRDHRAWIYEHHLGLPVEL